MRRYLLVVLLCISLISDIEYLLVFCTPYFWEKCLFRPLVPFIIGLGLGGRQFAIEWHEFEHISNLLFICDLPAKLASLGFTNTFHHLVFLKTMFYLLERLLWKGISLITSHCGGKCDEWNQHHSHEDSPPGKSWAGIESKDTLHVFHQRLPGAVSSQRRTVAACRSQIVQAYNGQLLSRQEFVSPWSNHRSLFFFWRGFIGAQLVCKLCRFLLYSKVNQNVCEHIHPTFFTFFFWQMPQIRIHRLSTPNLSAFHWLAATNQP